MKKLNKHKYTPFRPEWCQHNRFRGIDFCWGLASEVDRGRLEEWLKQKCESCDLSKHYMGDEELERRYGEKR